jgi:hypothetical protein
MYLFLNLNFCRNFCFLRYAIADERDLIRQETMKQQQDQQRAAEVCVCVCACVHVLTKNTSRYMHACMHA